MSDANAWFSDSLFNLLVDYYPEVSFRPYGTGATPRNVLPVLRDLELGCIIIYAKGHSGTTTFPSALKTEHPMLGRDMPAAFRRYTRKTGTRLFIYYSGQLDGMAGTAHPEWQMIGRDGKPLSYFAEFKNLVAHGNCPLSDYFDQWVAIHLRELIERYEPDGFWIDGDWAGPCYCPRCEARYRAETGDIGPMPEFNLLTPQAVAWTKVWGGIMHEWRLKFRTLIKSLSPDCMLSAGNVSSRREYLSAFDWRSGDWFSPNNHRLHMSLVARRYSVNGMPYDAYTCDTNFVHSREALRARTKTLPRMLQEGATLLANGAQWGYWTYPMPNGAFVPSKMKMASEAARFARARRDICLHTHHVELTAVLNPEPTVYIGNEIRGPMFGAAKSLIALHRSPVFLDETDLSDDAAFELVVLPETSWLPDSAVKQLERYVRRGGRLLTFGDAAVSSEPLRKLLGVRLTKAAALDDGHVIRRDGAASGVFAKWDRYALAGARQFYPLLLSWDQFNPGIETLRANWPIHGLLDEERPQKAGFPAATVRRLGRGLAVHVATNFMGVYGEYGNPDMLAWLREILDRMLPQPLVRLDAPECVELSVRHKGETLLLHLVNGNPGRDMSWVFGSDWWVDAIPALGPFTIELRCAAKPKGVTWEPDGTRLKHTYSNGVLRVVVPRLEIHGCVAITRWRRPAAAR